MHWLETVLLAQVPQNYWMQLSYFELADPWNETYCPYLHVNSKKHERYWLYHIHYGRFVCCLPTWSQPLAELELEEMSPASDLSDAMSLTDSGGVTL